MESDAAKAMERSTAKDIADFAEWSGTRLPAISAIPDVDDIVEASSPKRPSWLKNDDKSQREYFWEFVASEQQRIRYLQNAPALRKTGQPIFCEADFKPFMSPTHGDSKPRNTSAWTPEEDQILFDGLLIGNILQLWHRFDKEFGRKEEDVNNRARDLTMQDLLPRCWCLSREEASEEARKLTDDGEPELSQSEWIELVLWIRNGYVGINPSVFDWTRSTERLRQELRIFDDMHSSIFDRMAQIFAAEKASNEGREKKKTGKNKGKQEKTGQSSRRPQRLTIVEMMEESDRKSKRGQMND